MRTSAIQVTYSYEPESPSPFTGENLQIEILATGKVWRYGDADDTNLNGTYTSLDCYLADPDACISQYDRSTPLSPGWEWTFGMQNGLISRSGWSVMNDTRALKINSLWLAPPNFANVDVYFHTYALQNGSPDYRSAMWRWKELLGSPGLVPRRILGVWWSRYYPYSADDFNDQIIEGFKSAAIPLSTVSLDLDWHTEPSKPCSAWGQLDFNRSLFTDPQEFLNLLHYNKLAVTVNIHIQDGIDVCAENYFEFANLMGINPATNQTIECALDNELFVNALAGTYLRQAPLSSVDFLWPDFSGCFNTTSPYVGGGGGMPSLQRDIENMQLWASIALARIQRQAGKRPMLLSRHGGFGSHRVPLSFTGDTLQVPSALAYEIATSATAANALVALSHDIGGNHFVPSCQPPGTLPPQSPICAGSSDPANYTSSELFLRWVQFGIVSAVFRTHCDHCERRPWTFFYHADALKQAYRLREALVPYLYTNARETVDSGIQTVHPLYYDWPTEENAYIYMATQYMLGRDILCAPAQQLVGPTGIAAVQVWLPPGLWLPFVPNGSPPNGNVIITVSANHSEIPLFVRTNTLIPLKSPDMGAGSVDPDIIWAFWPQLNGTDGAHNNASVYEDEGEGLSWENGDSSIINAFAVSNGSTANPHIHFHVYPIEGSFIGQRFSRSHTLQIRLDPNMLLTLVNSTVNGRMIPQCNSNVIDCVMGWQIVTASKAELSQPLNSLIIHTDDIYVTNDVDIDVSWTHWPVGDI
jgi:alpha-glucosidase (family GH31 glycosyl hydrolase)